MFKKALVILAFALVVVPTAAMAQTYNLWGPIPYVTVKVMATNDQGAVYAYTSKYHIIATIEIALTDSNNGLATVTGNIIGYDANDNLYFNANNLLVPKIEKAYTGHVAITSGSMTWYNFDGYGEYAAFTGEGDMKIVLTKDKLGNVTGAILKLKPHPDNEESRPNSYYPWHPVTVDLFIPAIKLTPMIM